MDLGSTNFKYVAYWRRYISLVLQDAGNHRWYGSLPVTLDLIFHFAAIYLLHLFFLLWFKVNLYPYSSTFAHNDPDMLEVGVQGYMFNKKGDISTLNCEIFPFHLPPILMIDWLIVCFVGLPRTNLTERESQSHFSLWCIFSAPLIAGLDLSSSNISWAVDILTNQKAIAVNQVRKSTFLRATYSTLIVLKLKIWNIHIY